MNRIPTQRRTNALTVVCETIFFPSMSSVSYDSLSSAAAIIAQAKVKRRVVYKQEVAEYKSPGRAATTMTFSCQSITKRKELTNNTPFCNQGTTDYMCLNLNFTTQTCKILV